ncbi:MAG: HlyD family efflux transporter periplasmic adaptor subunit [Candidatus Ventricola sp.]
MSENNVPAKTTTSVPAPQTGKKPRRRRSRLARTVKKLVKTVVALVVLVAVGLFGLKAYIRSQAASGDDSASYSRATVQSGAMSETVYGTGTTSAKNQPNVLAQADGTLTDLRVAVGDTVQEGDILAVITNEDIDDTITDCEFALWELDETILETSAGSSVLSIKAPMAGRVMAIYAAAGDDALAVFRREGALAIISTDGRMRVEVDDVPKAANLALGDSVSVTGASVDVTGTVTDLTLQGTHATITINSDELPMGETVTVTTAAGQNVGTGTLEVNKPMEVSAYGGTIKSVSVKVGQKVERKDTLFRLEDSPLTLTLENLRLQREAAAKELEDVKAQRENLIVVAPCDGIIASLEVSEGDEITSGSLLCSILQGEDMKLTIAVDELDVVNVEAGQKVTITVGALSGVEISGEVYKIAPVGTNSGGVTTYDVELSFDAEGTGVRSGMNATGEIEIASKSSTLYVPVEAIMTINNTTYVMVEDGGSQSLASASTSTSASTGGSGTKGSRGTDAQGMGVPAGMGGMPEMGEAPAGMDASTAGEASRRGSWVQTEGTASEPAAQQEEEQSVLTRALNTAKSLYSGLMAWLYEDAVSTADTVTGSLVQVTVGMQNDDYAEILSGVSAGQTVLYTATSSSSSSSWNMNSRGGSTMGGMPMMGF